jgi:hypothetical protein
MADTVTDFDPARYLRAPVVDVAGGVALSIALLSSRDRSLIGAPAKAAKQLRTSVMALQSAWGQQRAAIVPKANPRPADQRLDRAWAAVCRRLETLSELPETVPEAKQAAALHALLFPEGLTFLALPFEKEWAESEQRLKQIDEGSNAKMLAALVGDFVLAELRTAHADYGRVLGITTAKEPETTTPALTEPLRALTQAIAAYALQLVAAGQSDPELMPAVRKALRPIDDIRTAQARRAAAGESPEVPDDAVVPPPSKVNPSTPVPEV